MPACGWRGARSRFSVTAAGNPIGMDGSNVLVVLLEDGAENALRREIQEREAGPQTVRVVAPTRVGTLEWVATDEDEARRQAERRALEAEWMLEDEAEVQAEAGDVDPVLAVEDALHGFEADEILLVGRPADDGVLEAALRRTGLPVRWLGQPPPPVRHPELREAIRAILAGRSRATPFAYFVAVNLALLALGAAITALVLLVLWLR
ncbi:MAG TPA: hypothetical protein VE596_19095 [Gaiellaceae bacterium]|jgi:hypothetical protein|nr:hypothetical protein [Gaiellaceae bacterium]